MIGVTLAHYRIEAKLGEGGMGVVYKARDTHLDRAVAIKVLLPEAVAKPERKRRFVQEAKAASALNHPNILHVYDMDCVDGVDFMAMGFVGGQTLEDRIGGQPLKLSDALKYAVQIADGLATAHAAGITHRDIEPGNIMVNEKELVKILSSPTRWAAKAMARQLPFVPAPKIVGTVAYMSPQQAEGKDVGAQSDIFRLARCSTRRSPDAGRSAAQAAWRLPC